MIRKFTLFSSLLFFMVMSLGQLNVLAQTVSAVGASANCPDQAKITATVSGFTGVVGYQLKQGATIVRPQGGSGFQTSNIFDGLPAGNYTVVANNGTQNAETASPVAVKINYTTITASVAPEKVACANATASLTVTATGGSGSYSYAITPTSEINSPVAASFQASATFSNLAVGSYKFWVKDNTCASATLVNTTGAVNNVPAPDANQFTVSPVLSFSNPNNHLSGYSVRLTSIFKGTVAMSSEEAASFTLEIMNGAVSVVGPVQVSVSGAMSIAVPNGLVGAKLNAVLKNTCTGNTKSFPVTVAGPSMSVFASCPGAQAMYRITPATLVSLPATITYTNQDGTTTGNKTINVTAAHYGYDYVDFPAGLKFDWKVVDAAGEEWTGTHDFTADLMATANPSQRAPTAYNCALDKGTINLIMPGLKNNQTLGFRILSAPIGSESLVGIVGTSFSENSNGYSLRLNGSDLFPKGTYRIEFIDAGCYNGRQMNVTAQGHTVSFTGVQTIANCGSFNFKLAGTYGTNIQQYIVEGPTGTVGLTKSNTETFTNMPYGAYKVAIRVLGLLCYLIEQDFTYTAESSIDYDILNSGGFTCTPGGTGDLIVTASTTIPGATLEYSKDNGATWQTSNIFPNLPEGNHTIIIRESGCGNQRTVSATITANLKATINNQPSPSSACTGENGVLNINAIGGINYTWTYPNATTHTGKTQNLTNLTPSMAGTYSVVVQSANCTTPPQHILLKVTTKPTIDVVTAQVACNGVTKSINFTGKAAREYTSAITFTEINTVYSWTNDNPAIGLAASGTGNISFMPTNTGNTPIIANISVTARGATGCDATVINFSITINPDTKITLSSAAGTDAQEKCISESISDISFAITNGTGATVTGLPAGVTGAYATGVFTISGTPTISGTFNYTITSNGGCATATTTGSITVTPNTTIGLSSATETQQQAICLNNKIANITYAAINATNVTVTGLPTGITGAYSNGVFTVSGIATEAGTFNYTVTANGSCTSATSNGSITVNELPSVNISSSTEQTSISKGDILTLTASGGTTYSWTGADIQGGANTASINVRPRQTTTYTVNVTNASGCTSELSITVTVIEDRKLIPNNIITPNGDDKNDYWTIKNIDYYPNNKVSVYDRAGRRVFFATGYQNNWDGSYAGSPLAEAAYFYVIDMGKDFGLIRGTINIIRDKR